MRGNGSDATLSPMLHVTLQLSDAQEAMLSERQAAGEFASIDAYLTALIDAETRLSAQQRLEGLLLEGVRSLSRPWTPEMMDEIRRAARLKH